MTAAGQEWINRVWYGGSPAVALLLPLGWLYRAVVAARRYLYRIGVLRSTQVGIPVIVVGNLTAGGTGKTPVTIWLADTLKARGLRPGVASRGYRGRTGHSPLPVLAHSDPAVVGDEPVLIAERCGCPVVVHPDRVAAALVLKEQGVDVVIADDGLQHYRLRRDVEIAVVDGARGWGNGRPLPAGPLREPVSRLQEVHQILVNSDGGAASLPDAPGGVPIDRFVLQPSAVHRLGSEERRSLADFARTRVHAVAAIGNPQRFFDLLATHGIEVVPHPLPDHAAIAEQDLKFGDNAAILITEKDAVKCRHLDIDNLWCVAVDAVMHDGSWIDRIERLVRDYDGHESD